MIPLKNHTCQTVAAVVRYYIYYLLGLGYLGPKPRLVTGG